MAYIANARPRVSAIAQILAQTLLERGYVIIPNLVDEALAEKLETDLFDRFDNTPFCEGAFYGLRTKRFGRLLLRSAHAAKFIQHELIMEIVDYVLKPYCDRVQLNLTQALEIHPGSPAQVPHRDQDMWAGPKGEIEYLINVMWPFTPYKRENGATIVWPESHKHAEEIVLPEEGAIDAEMRPGSALLFLGSTLHSAGQNSSRDIRRGMIVSYCLGWLKPYENQWLAYPPEIARTFPPELAALVGYCQHRPNLGNFEGQCPSILLQEKVPEFVHAIDELRPDQVQLIDDYYAGRLPVAA